jgi:hypothetical protein
MVITRPVRTRNPYGRPRKVLSSVFAYLIYLTLFVLIQFTPASKSEAQTARASEPQLLLAAIAVRSDSQRCTRLYFSLLDSGRIERNRRELSKCVEQFDDSISFLASTFQQVGDRDIDYRESRRLLTRMQDRWQTLRVRFQEITVDLALLESTNAASEEIYNYAQRLCVLLSDRFANEEAFATDLSGRTQALTERLTKAIMVDGIRRSLSSEVDIQTFIKEQETALNQLSSLKVSDAQAARHIQLGRQVLPMFKMYATRAAVREEKNAHIEVSRASEGMWRISSGLRDHYENLMRKTFAMRPTA